MKLTVFGEVRRLSEDGGGVLQDVWCEPVFSTAWFSFHYCVGQYYLMIDRYVCENLTCIIYVTPYLKEEEVVLNSPDEQSTPMSKSRPVQHITEFIAY